MPSTASQLLPPVLTLASRALSQACRNSSWPLASFSCCRAISSCRRFSLTCASSLSHWDRTRISLNCFCKPARLFPKTSEGLLILVRKKKRESERERQYRCVYFICNAGRKHAVNISAKDKRAVWRHNRSNLKMPARQPMAT